MQLRFPVTEIKKWADTYKYSEADSELMNLVPEVQKNGYLTKQQLLNVCKWKSPRSAGHVNKNNEDYVREITGFSFNTKNERATIESLTLLDGVEWPTASVILHLFHQQKYPILDFRALWSIQVDVPAQYTFDFWIEYTTYCRKLAKEAKVSMRILDRALWQYSKKYQTSN